MGHVLRCSGYKLVKSDMVRSQDCYFYDAEGKRYLDLESGVWCTPLGHNHPLVNQTIHAQIEQLSHISYRYTNDIVEQAAAQVVGTLGLDCCVFLSSGSEAVEFGVQAARRISQKPLLLGLNDAYLAAYGSAGTKKSDEWYSLDWSACPACPHVQTCDPQCPRLQAIPFERIGGFVFEPGNTGGLVRFPPKSLVQTLDRALKQSGGLLVVDEVTTGLGRTGAWYGLEHYELQADVVALGKGLGNGYPVSAVALTKNVARALTDGGFHYAQSHQNDPLGCAIANRVIETLRQLGLIERSRQVGADFSGQLERLAEKHTALRQVRGRGLMIALEFASEGEISALQAYHQLLKRGFLAGCKPAANLLRFYPPLTIKREDLAQLVRSLDEILQ